MHFSVPKNSIQQSPEKGNLVLVSDLLDNLCIIFSDCQGKLSSGSGDQISS